MSNLKLTRDINEIDIKLWAKFVYNHPLGTIFQTPEMFKVYLYTINYEPILLGLIDNKGDILGILLAVIQKEHSGILGKFSSRSIIWGGPLVKNNDLSLLNILMENYTKLISNKIIYSQIRNLWRWEDKEREVFLKHGFVYEYHLDIIHDLSKPINEQLMLMSKGRRKNIRRASKKGVEFNIIERIEDLKKGYDLIKSTYKRIAIPLPDFSLFENAFKIMGDKDLVKYFAALYKGEMIGFRAVLCYKGLIYDWYAGSSYNNLDKYPNDFLIWKIMEWGHKNGYKIFDFGGAGKLGVPYGVRDYKLKFGGKLVEFGRFKYIHNRLLFKIGKLGLLLNRFFPLNKLC